MILYHFFSEGYSITKCFFFSSKSFFWTFILDISLEKKKKNKKKSKKKTPFFAILALKQKKTNLGDFWKIIYVPLKKKKKHVKNSLFLCFFWVGEEYYGQKLVRTYGTRLITVLQYCRNLMRLISLRKKNQGWRVAQKKL